MLWKHFPIKEGQMEKQAQFINKKILFDKNVDFPEFPEFISFLIRRIKSFTWKSKKY